jgi:uncharacterized protein YpmB
VPGLPLCDERALAAKEARLAMTPAAKNGIIIVGPKDDGTYVIEFRTAEGEALAIWIPRSEAHVIRHSQERMPYGLFVPEVPTG